MNGNGTVNGTNEASTLETVAENGALAAGAAACAAGTTATAIGVATTVTTAGASTAAVTATETALGWLVGGLPGGLAGFFGSTTAAGWLGIPLATTTTIVTAPPGPFPWPSRAALRRSGPARGSSAGGWASEQAEKKRIFARDREKPPRRACRKRRNGTGNTSTKEIEPMNDTTTIHTQEIEAMNETTGIQTLPYTPETALRERVEAFMQNFERGLAELRLEFQSMLQQAIPLGREHLERQLRTFASRMELFRTNSSASSRGCRIPGSAATSPFRAAKRAGCRKWVARLWSAARP